MEFKGITWAYQKFEAMCLEAEEAILEDTAKYIKKFYSDVMEDLLPPPVASGDADIDKKPKPNKESLQIGYYDVHSLVPQSPGISVENKCSEPCGTIGKKVGAHRRSIGIKRISKNDRPSKDSSGMSSSSVDRRSKLASSDTSSSRVASDNIKRNASRPETPIESHASDKILSAESVRPNTDDNEFLRPNKYDSESVRTNKDASECTSLASDDNLSAESVRLKEDPLSNSHSPTEPHGTSLSDVSFSPSGSSNACNIESENKVMVYNEGASKEVGSSNVRTTYNAAESLDKKTIMPNEDMLEMEVIEKDGVGVVKRVNIEMDKLEESCVMVDKTELHSVPPQEAMKHKSYKKRIQEALWLKSRSRRGNDKGGEVKVGAADSYDSDWELL